MTRLTPTTSRSTTRSQSFARQRLYAGERGHRRPHHRNLKGYTTDLTVTSPADPVSTSTPGTEKVDSGLPGDVLVLVYNVNGDNTRIWQLIIYYRDIATTAGGTNGTNSTTVATRTGPLKRLVCPIFDDGTLTSTNPQKAGIMKLLPYITTSMTGAVTIFPYVTARPTTWSRPLPSIAPTRCSSTSMTRASWCAARIYENYTAQRIVKSTYNFTVTPRG